VRESGGESEALEPYRWIGSLAQAGIHFGTQVAGGDDECGKASHQRNHDRMPAIVAELAVCLER
jgi:hypothetical protein